MAKPLTADFVPDSLDDLLGTSTQVIPNPAYGAAGQPWPNDDTAETLARIRETVASVAAPLHKERCSKCRGSGRFRSYSGRDCGPCFTCKGLGYKEFKTSTESRVKARVQATARKVKNAAESWSAFAALHSDLASWIVANPSFEFAAKMRAAVETYGALTERQELGVRKCIARNAEYSAKRAAAVVTRESAALPIDTTAIESAFQAAGATLQRPKLRAGAFVISPAGAASVNAGSLYVKDSKSGTYLGKITAGRFYQSRDCTAELESAFRTVANDPRAAAIKHGKETGICACCGITLTNPESIARGIGPICADKYGW